MQRGRDGIAVAVGVALACALIVSAAAAPRPRVAIVAPQWARLVESAAGSASLRAVAAAPGGGVFAAGSCGPAADGAPRDLLVVRYDAAGALVWRRTYDRRRGTDEGLALAVDRAGGVVVTGLSAGAGGDTDVLTVRYSASGTRTWVATYGGTAGAADVGFDVTVDPRGDIYVAGYASVAGRGSDALVLKYTPSGRRLWARTAGGARDDQAAAVACDGGGVAIAGFTGGQQSAGGGLVARWHADGTPAWSRRYDGEGGQADAFLDLALATDGSCYVVGASTRTNRLSSDALLARYSPAGRFTWAATAGPGTLGFSRYACVAVDHAGDVVVAGTFAGGSARDMLVAKYRRSGRTVWQRQWNDYQQNLGDDGRALALDPSGGVYVAGQSSTNWGKQAVALAFSPAGTMRWMSMYPQEPESAGAWGVACGGGGAVYAAGDAGTGASAAAGLLLKYPR